MGSIHDRLTPPLQEVSMDAIINIPELITEGNNIIEFLLDSLPKLTIIRS